MAKPLCDECDCPVISSLIVVELENRKLSRLRV
jgi:hypothetical protein